MEVKSTETSDHVPHKLLSRDTREGQPSSQRWYREGNECCITHAPLCLQARATELKVLQIRE